MLVTKNEPYPYEGKEIRRELRQQYEGRINRAIDYISGHLDEPLSLEQLAKVAAFSPFHFHRVFSALVGESLGTFIKRMRLERAAARLVSNSSISITEVALDYGYTSPASFARAFKEQFGLSATEWRAARSKDGKANSKDGKANSKDGNAAIKERSYLPLYQVHREHEIERRTSAMNIEIKELSARRIAYARAFGPYYESASKAWETICRWAGPRGLFGPNTLMIGLSHDDPSITPPDKLRYDAGVTVGEEIQAERDIGIQLLQGGKYAVAYYEGSAEGFKAAYGEIFGCFMSESGYQPADAPCYEVYYNDPQRDGIFKMDICVPVKPL